MNRSAATTCLWAVFYACSSWGATPHLKDTVEIYSKAVVAKHPGARLFEVNVEYNSVKREFRFLTGKFSIPSNKMSFVSARSNNVEGVAPSDVMLGTGPYHLRMTFAGQGIAGGLGPKYEAVAQELSLHPKLEDKDWELREDWVLDAIKGSTLRFGDSAAVTVTTAVRLRTNANLDGRRERILFGVVDKSSMKLLEKLSDNDPIIEVLSHVDFAELGKLQGNSYLLLDGRNGRVIDEGHYHVPKVLLPPSMPRNFR